MKRVFGAASARLKSFSLSPRDDVEVVHQDDHVEIASMSDDGEDARVRRIEFLRVRMQFENLETERCDARDLFEGSLAVIRMDRRNRQHLRVFLCEGKVGVVACLDVRRMSAQGLVWAAKPHAAEPDQADPCGFGLRLILSQRRFACPQMHMAVEDLLGRYTLAQEQSKDREYGLKFHAISGRMSSTFFRVTCPWRPLAV